MLEFATPFHVRAAKLKSPSSPEFNAGEWKAAYAAEQNPTKSDEALLAAALWLAGQAAARRAAFSDVEFDALGRTVSVVLAIATLNREFWVTDLLSDEMRANAHKEGAVAFGHIIGRPLRAGATGQSVTADESSEGTGDAVESWLYDAYVNSGHDGAVPADLAPVAFRAMKRYSIQHGLNDIWNQGIWEGWRLTSDGNELSWGPADKELATKLHAALVRQQENFMNFPFIDLSMWAALKPEGRRRLTIPRTVTDVSASGRRKIRIGRPECRSKRPPMFLIERAGLEGSYLNFLMEVAFPNEPKFTLRLVLQAWAVIFDLARALAKPLSWPEHLSLRDAEKMALVVSHQDLLDVLMRALAMDKTTAQAMIKFLAYAPKKPKEKGHRGIWAAPLVPIPGEDSFALAFPALATSNTLRKAEAWLERGGLDDNLSGRGDLFEADYRAKIVSAIQDNPLLVDASCAKNSIKKDANFDEQVDLLVRLGDLLIVGEVKCWLYPADSFERFNHFRKIKGAAAQAKRKADLLRLRPDVAARALGLSVDDVRALRVVPLVVANQGFGFSLDADGCRVTDAAYLLTYLSNGAISSGMAIDTQDGRTRNTTMTLYEREKQASDKFGAHFENPPVLQRFVDRISWTTVEFPLPAGGKLHFAVPRLSDIRGEERMLAAMMGHDLRG